MQRICVKNIRNYIKKKYGGLRAEGSEIHEAKR
jgi:hypothetical protein